MGKNNLSVGKMTRGQGKNVLIPISLENTDEVVALQFDLQLPFAKTSGKQPTLTNRNTNGHTVSVRGMGSNRYRVVIVNMSNKPIAGSGGGARPRERPRHHAERCGDNQPQRRQYPDWLYQW